MVYSINVDWSNSLEDGWENLGRQILVDSCEHKTQEGCGENTNMEYSGYCEECKISESDSQPMMNYAYPLETTPNTEDILKVVKKTCLTVMEKEGNYYLVLCGGGMDLSQQIGLAFILIEKWLPIDLLKVVSTQKGLSVYGEDWILLRKSIIEQLKMEEGKLSQKIKDWENTKQ